MKREEKNLTKGPINNQNNEMPDITPNRISDIKIQGPNFSNVLEIYSYTTKIPRDYIYKLYLNMWKRKKLTNPNFEHNTNPFDWCNIHP